MAKTGGVHQPAQGTKRVPIQKAAREAINAPDRVVVGVDGRRRARARRMNFIAVNALASKLRAAQRGYSYAPAVIYDATGKPIATMDPETRERKPL